MQRSGPQLEPHGLGWRNVSSSRVPQGLGFSTRRVRASRCRRLLENPCEAHLSAASQEPSQDPRLSCTHEDRQRPSRHQQPPPQGARAPGRHRLQEVSESALPSGALGSAGERRSMRLTPSDRLRKRFEFRRLRDRGRRVHTPSFVFLIAPSQYVQPRVGITVSKQVGDAVRRNRVKRLVREAFRQQRSFLPPASDLVVIARAGCTIDRLADVVAEFVQARGPLSTAWRKLAARGGGHL